MQEVKEKEKVRRGGKKKRRILESESGSRTYTVARGLRFHGIVKKKKNTSARKFNIK